MLHTRATILDHPSYGLKHSSWDISRSRREFSKPGFHIIAPVATVVEKRVWHKSFVLSDGSDTVFPYDCRCRWIFVFFVCLALFTDTVVIFVAVCLHWVHIWHSRSVAYIFLKPLKACKVLGCRNNIPAKSWRNRFNFLQIPPVTSSDIFKFFLRIGCTHIKLFAYLRSSSYS